MPASSSWRGSHSSLPSRGALSSYFPGIPWWAVQDYQNSDSWGPCRSRLGHLLRAKTKGGTNIFDFCIGVAIVCNVFFMIAETDASQACDLGVDCVPSWITHVGYVFLGIYTIEVALRMCVDRAMYLFIPWNLLDLFIVLSGLVGICLTGVHGSGVADKVQLMRIARVIRVVRVAKVLTKFETLRNMIKGFAGAMAAMFWGFVLILILIVIWSLFAVELMNRTNQDIYDRMGDPTNRCATAFSSVYQSTLLFFQTLVAGDSWGACAMPLIDEKPMAFLIFAGALVCIQLGFTNLVLAVIVDKAAEARESDRDEKVAEQKAQKQEALDVWRTIMRRMDQDSNGTVTLREVLDGFEDEEMKDRMNMMSIDEKDMGSLFHLMDIDDTGTLEYDEFVDTFHKAQTQEPHVYSMVMKLEISKIKHMLEKLVGSSGSAAGSPPASPMAGSPKSRSFATTTSSNKSKVFRRDAQLRKQQLRRRPSDTSSDYKDFDFKSLSIRSEEAPIQKVPSSWAASRAKLYQQDQHLGAAPSSPCANEQKADDWSSPFSEELRGLRHSMEVRLDGIASEAAGIIQRLSSQEVLLDTLSRSSTATTGPEASDEAEAPIAAECSAEAATGFAEPRCGAAATAGFRPPAAASPLRSIEASPICASVGSNASRCRLPPGHPRQPC